MFTAGEVLEDVRAIGGSINWKPIKAAFALLAAIGAAAFAAGLAVSDPRRIWQAYLVNFVLWLGIATGSLLISAILVMTNARWGRPIKRLAEAPAAFLPVAFVLFWGIYAGREYLFPWIHLALEPPKSKYLTIGFLFARDGGALAVLAGLGIAMLLQSVRADRQLFESGKKFEGPAPEPRDAQGFKAQVLLSPIYIIAFSFLLTMIAWDLIMSLDPEWVSTLFGAYYFIGGFYSGIAATIILTGIMVLRTKLGTYIGPKQLHDLGKLMFAFCIVMADFFYVQFLVIWYGNMPDETKYVIRRVNFEPWTTLSWVVLFVCFVIPFLILLLRKIKMKPAPMIALSCFILVGMWLERFLLVAPSVWRKDWMPIGIYEILITAGFLGLMGLCVSWFLERYPLLPVADPLFWDALKEGGVISTPAE